MRRKTKLKKSIVKKYCIISLEKKFEAVRKLITSSFFVVAVVVVVVVVVKY